MLSAHMLFDHKYVHMNRLVHCFASVCFLFHLTRSACTLSDVFNVCRLGILHFLRYHMLQRCQISPLRVTCKIKPFGFGESAAANYARRALFRNFTEIQTKTS